VWNGSTGLLKQEPKLMLTDERDKFRGRDLCSAAYAVSFPTRQYRRNHSDKACTMLASIKILEDIKVSTPVQRTGIRLKVI